MTLLTSKVLLQPSSERLYQWQDPNHSHFYSNLSPISCLNIQYKTVNRQLSFHYISSMVSFLFSRRRRCDHSRNKKLRDYFKKETKILETKQSM